MPLDYVNQTTLDVTTLAPEYQHQLRSASVARAMLSPNYVINGGGAGRTVTFPRYSGRDVTSTALVPGADIPSTTPSDASASASIQAYPTKTRLDGLTKLTTPGSILQGVVGDLVGWLGEQMDHLAFAAMAAATTYQTIVGQTATTALTASDTITTAAVRTAVAALRARKVPPFLIPGIGPVYIGAMHPHVEFDWLNESSGDVKTALINVNASNWSLNTLGVQCGVLWIPTAMAPIEADGGDTNVDVYRCPIVGQFGLGMAYAPVEEYPGVPDVDMTGALSGFGSDPLTGAPVGMRAGVARVMRPSENIGYYTEAGAIFQGGFAVANPLCLQHVACASSLGANT